MNITLSEHTQIQEKSDLQQQFDKLWREVKNKQKNNIKLKEELAQLYCVYQTKILPLEQLNQLPHVQLTERLIDFYSRKSLTQWQREELSQWIFECIENIEPYHPEKALALTEAYIQTEANFLGVDIEDIKNEMEQTSPSDELFEFFKDFEEELSATENRGHSNSNDDIFGFSNDDAYDGFFEQGDSNADNIHHATSHKVNDIFNDKWLRTIFRRTANALHPDKERNEYEKKNKEKLMSELLKYRDEKDIFSLLNLYMQHVDSDDLTINDSTMTALCEQLKEQKKQLSEERQEILHDNPYQFILYKQLYSKSPKKQKQNIERHIENVKNSSDEFTEFVASLRNLKILKLHLSERFDDKRFAHFDRDFFD